MILSKNNLKSSSPSSSLSFQGPSSSLIPQLPSPTSAAKPSSHHLQPSSESSVISSSINQLNQPSTSTLLDSNQLDSESILTMLQPRLEKFNHQANHSIDSFNQNSNHLIHQNFGSNSINPNHSLMIDIHPLQSPQNHTNCRQTDYISDTSPSPSLIRHHHPSSTSSITSAPSDSPSNQTYPHSKSNQSKNNQDIFKNHKPISNNSNILSSINISHDQNSSINNNYQTHYSNQKKHFFNLPTDLITNLKQIWNQERDHYLSNQNLLSNSNTRNGYVQLNQHQSALDLNSQDGNVGPNPSNQNAQQSNLNLKELALWRWNNVTDLDEFLQQVYSYYIGNGIWVIGLVKLFNLLTVGFVIGFSTFLIGCIDYSILKKSHHLHQVIVPKCVSRFSGFGLLFVLGFSSYYAWKVLKFGQEIARLWQMHEFFTHLLEVSEADIQTIPWHGIVDKLSALTHQHPSSFAHQDQRSIGSQSVQQRKLDAHDIANQIMREHNYLIALFNKDILDLRPPLPNKMVGNALFAETHLTTSLEWNVTFCLRGYLFDQRGQVKPEFLVSRLNSSLASGLRKRFMLLALANTALAPFIVIYVLIYSFFRYFEEYHKNPSSIGSRSFTRLAQWKFREYNELPHLFQSRLLKSYSISKRYVDQFPKTKTTILAKFVSFIAGSFAAILIVLSLFDPDAFLHFEITQDRSVLFYIGLFGSILAISRGMIPKPLEEPIETSEEMMEQIVQLTHYFPSHWYGKLHGLEVYNEFCGLFQLKIINFLQEIMSVLLTPFILWYNFTDERCQRIVDFFREFTIHVDGIGYVCSFALFDFNKLGLDQDEDSSSPIPHQKAALTDLRPRPIQQERQQDIDKMGRSMLSFVAHHPNWEPSNQTASLYLSKAIGYSGVDSVYRSSMVEQQHGSAQTSFIHPGSTFHQFRPHNLGPGLNRPLHQPRNVSIPVRADDTSTAMQGSMLTATSSAFQPLPVGINSFRSLSQANRRRQSGMAGETILKKALNDHQRSKSTMMTMGVEAIDEEETTGGMINIGNTNMKKGENSQGNNNQNETHTYEDEVLDDDENPFKSNLKEDDEDEEELKKSSLATID
ncbi:hypothetical protein O181_019196 [Austropuccinia psidii MF-1]|uniref:Autophagy-related protein 9 n=1 Tax=Austropuccinia psidii MF-1 TaxID=1389203 RepID=A0A9Q3CB19_9BASI|nr:hypothetical protein [Austropuccinia psidii MF-1]